ncbi:MAG: hypothetical protein K2I79_05015, partial [Clostridia bacterium]|nr:hypothetical protein [Clostridia bacterium]
DNTIDGALGTDTGVGINFSTLIKSLLGEYPQIDLGSVITGGNSVLEADELAATAEEEQSANLDIGYIVAKLLGVISLENSALMIKATSSVLDSLMTDLLGVTLGLDVDLNLLLGILNGDIAASLRLDNITVNAELELNINDGNDYGNFNIPDMQFINMDVEQSTGTQMAISLLQNSGLNLTMDIVNANVESLAYYNYQTETYKYGYPNTVRAGIEILSADRQITDNLNSKAYISAKAGGILVTLYNIDTAEYNTKGSGNKTALLHVYIGPDDTLTVALCKGIFVASAKWALSTFIVDLGDGISGSGLSGLVGSIVGDVIPLVIRSSGLGLMNTLGGLLDNIIDMLIGDKAEAEETPSNPGTGDTSSGTGTIVSDFNIRVVKSAQNLNP